MKSIAYIIGIVLGAVTSFATAGVLSYGYNQVLISTLGLGLPVLTYIQVLGIVIFIGTLFMLLKSPEKEKDEDLSALERIYTVIISKLFLCAFAVFEFWVLTLIF